MQKRQQDTDSLLFVPGQNQSQGKLIYAALEDFGQSCRGDEKVRRFGKDEADDKDSDEYVESDDCRNHRGDHSVSGMLYKHRRILQRKSYQYTRRGYGLQHPNKVRGQCIGIRVIRSGDQREIRVRRGSSERMEIFGKWIHS